MPHHVGQHHVGVTAVRRIAAGSAVLAMAFGGLAVVPAAAATHDLTILTFNDYHGRITIPDFFATLENARQAAGEDQSIVLSVGDNEGASLFESSILGDNPTIETLNAMDVDASVVGNHEFDKGWSHLQDRIAGTNGATKADFPYVSANIDGVTPSVQPYTIIERNGVKVGYIGATTAELPSLVSPAGIKGLTVTDPVAAVNKYAEQLSDGDESNGEADVIVAGYHDGAIDSITNETDPNVDVILTAHTHETYVRDAQGRPLTQAGSYGDGFNQIKVTYDDVTKEVTAKADPADIVPTEEGAAEDSTSPRIAEVQDILARALEASETEGAKKIATATAAFSRGGMGLAEPAEDRGDESTMSNLVANMFSQYLSDVTGKDVIGVQNPGGTRADLDEGEVTFKEAASILPFANTLMTTQITGAQFKTLLEQQWQPDGSSRPYLALSLSDNVSWTFDESRPAGDRVTSITIDGKPIDPKATYVVGSGSFLISGGDNFAVLADGTNPTDTGWTDLDAWSAWLQEQGTVTPSFAKNGVEVSGPTTLTQDKKATLLVGGSSADAAAKVANGTLDMTSVDFVKNSSVTATIGDIEVGTAEVSDGAADLALTVPCSVKAGDAVLTLTAADSGTTVTLPVTVKSGACTTPTPSATPTSADTTPTAKPAGTDGGRTGGLADTGAPVSAIALGALALIGAGASLVRRKK